LQLEDSMNTLFTWTRALPKSPSGRKIT